jgi:tripeptidyl-peptidase-1
MFGRFKPKKSNVVWLGKAPEQLEVSEVTSSTGVSASCNETITISCLRQIYNIGDYDPKAKGNSIGITGYLGQFANFADLQSFYAEQVPAAKGSSFKEILINGASALRPGRM